VPVGLQIVGARFEEPRILSLAKIVAQMNPIGWPTYG
jgi:amidase